LPLVPITGCKRAAIKQPYTQELAQNASGHE
jgi:hypothetical protein